VVGALVVLRNVIIKFTNKLHPYKKTITKLLLKSLKNKDASVVETALSVIATMLYTLPTNQALFGKTNGRSALLIALNKVTEIALDKVTKNSKNTLLITHVLTILTIIKTKFPNKFQLYKNTVTTLLLKLLGSKNTSVVQKAAQVLLEEMVDTSRQSPQGTFTKNNLDTLVRCLMNALKRHNTSTQTRLLMILALTVMTDKSGSNQSLYQKLGLKKILQECKKNKDPELSKVASFALDQLNK